MKYSKEWLNKIQYPIGGLKVYIDLCKRQGNLECDKIIGVGKYGKNIVDFLYENDENQFYFDEISYMDNEIELRKRTNRIITNSDILFIIADAEEEYTLAILEMISEEIVNNKENIGLSIGFINSGREEYKYSNSAIDTYVILPKIQFEDGVKESDIRKFLIKNAIDSYATMYRGIPIIGMDYMDCRDVISSSGTANFYISIGERESAVSNLMESIDCKFDESSKVILNVNADASLQDVADIVDSIIEYLHESDNLLFQSTFNESIGEEVFVLAMYVINTVQC